MTMTNADIDRERSRALGGIFVACRRIEKARKDLLVNTNSDQIAILHRIIKINKETIEICIGNIALANDLLERRLKRLER